MDYPKTVVATNYGTFQVTALSRTDVFAEAVPTIELHGVQYQVTLHLTRGTDGSLGPRLGEGERPTYGWAYLRRPGLFADSPTAAARRTLQHEVLPAIAAQITDAFMRQGENVALVDAMNRASRERAEAVGKLAEAEEKLNAARAALNAFHDRVEGRA